MSLLLRFLLLIMMWVLPVSALADVPRWYGDDVQNALPSNPEAADDQGDPSTSIGVGPADRDAFEEYDPEEETVVEDDVVAEDPAPDGAGTQENQGSASDADSAGESDGVFWDDDTVVAERRGIQGPRPPVVPDPDPPGWLEDFFDWLESMDGPDADLDALFRWGAYLAAGLLGLLLLAFLFRMLRRFQLPQLPQAEDGSALDALRELTGAQHHSKLADVRQWDIAIHALLLDVFERLESSHEFVNAPAVTCREIAVRIEPQGGPLADLVAISESSVFALLPASEEDYLRALSLHSSLVGAQ